MTFTDHKASTLCSIFSVLLFWDDNGWQNIDDSVRDMSVSTRGSSSEVCTKDSAGDKDALYLCPKALMHTNSQHMVNLK